MLAERLADNTHGETTSADVFEEVRDFITQAPTTFLSLLMIMLKNLLRQVL